MAFKSLRPLDLYVLIVNGLHEVRADYMNDVVKNHCLK